MSCFFIATTNKHLSVKIKLLLVQTVKKSFNITTINKHKTAAEGQENLVRLINITSSIHTN